MGEAKRKRALAEIRGQGELKGTFQEMSVPDDAQFVGYVIYVAETDDYLGRVVERLYSTERFHVSSPESAMKFETKEAARKVAKGIKKRWVIGALYDIGNKLMVGLEEGPTRAH